MTPDTSPAHGLKASHPAHTDTMPGILYWKAFFGPRASSIPTWQTAIDKLDQTPLAPLEDLDDEEDGEAAADAAQEGVGDGQRHHRAVPRRGDPTLRAAVKRKEAEDEDKCSEANKRHGMARERNTLIRKLIYWISSYNFTFGPNLPSLGPSMMAPTRAQVPPARCTTPDPAKSWKALRKM